MPDDKMVVLGLVSSTEAAVESRDYLLERLSTCSPRTTSGVILSWWRRWRGRFEAGAERELLTSAFYAGDRRWV